MRDVDAVFGLDFSAFFRFVSVFGELLFSFVHVLSFQHSISPHFRLSPFDPEFIFYIF